MRLLSRLQSVQRNRIFSMKTKITIKKNNKTINVVRDSTTVLNKL